MTKIKVISDRLNTFFTNNKIVTGDSIPTSGEWVKGDICISTLQENRECGWICVESGSPGKWDLFGSGGGGGKLVTLTSSVEVDTPVTEVSLEGLGTSVTNNDKLFVHYNSTHLLEGVDFEVVDGIKIRKLGEGSWNESSSRSLFAFELLKQVEKVDNDKIVLDSKLTVLKSNKTISSPTNEVEIGIEGFNKDTDYLTVYKNSTFLVEGVDYEVSLDSSKIVSRNGNWNNDSISNYTFSFVIIKEIESINPEAVVGTENIKDGSVTMSKLSRDVKEAMNSISDIDLSGYVEKNDIGNKEDLQTDNKNNIVEAINENKTSILSLEKLVGEANKTLIEECNKLLDI